MQGASDKACLPNTRVQLLATIMDWVFDPTGTRCFYIYGTAGQGKSAVAHSVARQLEDMGVAASFFAFDRTTRDRAANQLFPTIVRKLAYVDQHHLEQLRGLRTDLLETNDIHDQCERLLLSCLHDYLVLTPIIIVIDALDECPNDSLDEKRTRQALLKAITRCLKDDCLHPYIRFFITARLDSDIRSALLNDSRSTRLHSIDAAAETEADIHKFVSSRLVDSRDVACYVDIVAQAAQTHFECAALLCRELTNGGRPMSRNARRDLIERVKSQPGRTLYETYHLILRTHLDKTDESCLSTYRQLLAWVLAVRQPQPYVVLHEIATLMLPEEDVTSVLEGLGSLLAGTVINSQEPIRSLHTSFRDFVLDAKASGLFAITSEFDAADSQLALACLRIMGRQESGLRYNICDLPSPFVYKKDIKDLSGCLIEHISSGLRYACRELSAHLSRSCPRSSPTITLALVSALKGFLQDRFLFWLEACGWLGYEPCESLQLTTLRQEQTLDDVPLIVVEFIAFEKRFREAISTSPPQVYITGLLFAPVDSHVSKLYHYCVASPIEISGYEQEKDKVLSVAYSPDGTKIVAGLSDHTLRLWDAGTGRQIGAGIRGHERVVCSVAFSPDGSRIASGSGDNTVRLWDTKTGQQQGEASCGHTYSVRSVAFSPDGSIIVSGSDDCTLRTWDAKTGKEMGEALEGHTGAVTSVVFSHNGTRIVCGAEDGTARIWEVATRQQLGDPIRHKDWVRSVAISRDGKYMASGSDDGTIRVLDAGGRQQVWTFQGHTGWIYSVGFSPDCTRIVSGGSDHIMRIWDATSGRQVGDDYHGHTDNVNTVAFSPDGKHVASGSRDGTIRVWDVREVKKERSIPVGHTGGICSVACSSDGNYIVSGSRDETVRLWDAQTGQSLGEPMRGHHGIVNCVTFSADGSRVASASNDRTVRVWDVKMRLPVGDVLYGHDSGVLCVTFSPDGTWLVSGSADRTLRLWDAVTGRQIGEALYGHEDWVRSVTFSSDGLTIASGSDDGSIRLWGAQSQLQRGALRGHQGHVRSVVFSPDDMLLVSGSDDGTIHLWDVKTDEIMGELLTSHTGWMQSVSFSTNGRYAVVGSNDRTVRIWNVQTRQQVGDALRGHEGRVVSIAFSSDSTHIISGSMDGTIRIWACASLQSSKSEADAARTDTTRFLLQSALQENQDSWLFYEENGTQRPILWIPHHLRRYHRVYSPFHVQFIPPTTPQMRITLNDLFQLDEWPKYTPAYVAEEPSEALEPEE
ncbi:hypothetical protein GGG16DRAFT_55096 [Schizophyllum commune]